VQIEVKPLSAHNLNVAGDHTYFVGETGAWVHNACGRMTPDQQALKELVDEATNGARKPLSVEMQIL